MIYASTENLKCFVCGELGHKRFTCPHKDDQWPSTSCGNVESENEHQQDLEKQSTETQEEGTSEEVSDANVDVRSVEQPDSDSEIVTDETDKREVQEGNEGMCEQAGGSEDNVLMSYMKCPNVQMMGREMENTGQIQM